MWFSTIYCLRYGEISMSNGYIQIFLKNGMIKSLGPYDCTDETKSIRRLRESCREHVINPLVKVIWIYLGGQPINCYRLSKHNKPQRAKKLKIVGNQVIPLW